MNPEPLRHTLQNLLRADVSGNPALDRLVLDYANYHGVFLLLGTPIALMIGLVAFLSWRRVLLRRGWDGRRRERRTTVVLGGLSTVMALFLGLVLVGNASNVLNPRRGFSSLVETLSPAAPGSELAHLRQSFDLWVSSGGGALPAVVNVHVQERLAWQQPKAVVCGLLLVLLTALTMKRWNRMVKTNVERHATAAHLGSQLGLGLAVLVICLLALMFIANAQAAFAPLTITMLYG